MDIDIQMKYEVAVARKDLINRNFFIANHKNEITSHCSTCLKTMPLTQFYERLDRKSGIRRECISCNKRSYQFGTRRTVSAKDKEIYKLEMKRFYLEVERTDQKMIHLHYVQKVIVAMARSRALVTHHMHVSDDV